jgi:hypothetical protein
MKKHGLGFVLDLELDEVQTQPIYRQEGKQGLETQC